MVCVFSSNGVSSFYLKLINNTRFLFGKLILNLIYIRSKKYSNKKIYKN